MKFEYDLEVFLDNEDKRLVIRAEGDNPITERLMIRMVADIFFDMAIRFKLTPKDVEAILNEATQANVPKLPTGEA